MSDLSQKEANLKAKLKRIQSGEMQCFRPGAPKEQQEALQRQAEAHCETQIKEVRAAMPAKKETK